MTEKEFSKEWNIAYNKAKKQLKTITKARDVVNYLPLKVLVFMVKHPHYIQEIKDIAKDVLLEKGTPLHKSLYK